MACDLAHLGFVNYLVPKSDVLETAAKIATLAPLAMQGTKQAALSAVADRLPNEELAWAISDAEVFPNRRSADFAEGIRTFGRNAIPSGGGVDDE